MPAFPGARGWAANITHGSGRHTTPNATVYKVTNLNASGSGSLAAGLALNTPRIIVFEVGGYISLGANADISNNYCWIAGGTAPDPGITLRKTTLNITADEVLVQHIRVLAGDETGSPALDSRDSITLNGANGVYIQYCTFMWSVDECMGMGPSQANNDVTFDRCIFSEPLRQGGHSEGNHDYGLLLNSDNQRRITFVNCLASSMQERFLRFRGVTLEKINCIGYNMTGNAGWNNGTPHSSPTSPVHTQKFDLRGCYYKQPPSVSTNTQCLQVGNTGAPTSDSKYFVEGNICPARPTDSGSEWLAVKTGNTSTQLNEADDKSLVPVADSGTITPTSPTDAYADVITNGNVGMRPEARKLLLFEPDTRVLNEVINNTGSIKNTVASAGGWPVITPTTRALSVPASPNTVMPSGYTAVEEWIHGYNALVEAPSAGTEEPQTAIRATRTTQTWGASADSVDVGLTVTTAANAIARLTNTTHCNLCDAAGSATSYNNDDMVCRVGVISGSESTLSRPSTGDNVDCISAIEVLECLDPTNASGFSVVFDGSVSMTTAELTKDSTALSGIDGSNYTKCVVILKGMTCDETARFWDRLAPTFAIVESGGSYYARVTRSAHNSTVTATYDIAVLKFGLNYNVEYFTHTIAAKGTDEEITISDSEAWTKKFIISYHRPVATNRLCADIGWTTRPGSSATKIYCRVNSACAVNGGIITGWVISHDELLVQHLDSITGGSTDFVNTSQTQSYTITTLEDLGRASIWCYADSTDTGQNYTRQSRNYRLTSTTAFEKRDGRLVSGSGDFAAAIVTWPLLGEDPVIEAMSKVRFRTLLGTCATG